MEATLQHDLKRPVQLTDDRSISSRRLSPNQYNSSMIRVNYLIDSYLLFKFPNTQQAEYLSRRISRLIHRTESPNSCIPRQRNCPP